MDKDAQKKKADLGSKVIIAVCVLLAAAVIFFVMKDGFDGGTEENSSGKSDIRQEHTDEENAEREEDKENIEEESKEEQQSLEENSEEPVPAENTHAASKPVIVPEMLPEGELLAAYNKTLIIGDSRTEGFRLYSGVKNASYFCAKGISVDKIASGQKLNIQGNQLSVYDLLDSTDFDKVIIAVGMNELGWTYMDSFLAEYGKLIDGIRAKQPEAKLFLHAVLPVTEEKDKTDSIYNNRQIYWYNENIMKLAADKNAVFVNPAGAVTDENGFLVADATTDGVHLTSQYCRLWANYLAEMI
ncbi:MAG: GDSL-type esterase/lipase family protein [Anaerovoracaceae bacterium]